MGPTCMRGLANRIVVAAAALCLAISVLIGQEPQPPTKPKELTAEQKVKLKERDRLKAEVEKLRKEEKLAEAVAACEKMLAIEREVFGELHDDVVGTLNRLAGLLEESEDWPTAKKHREEVLRIQTKRFGEKDWRAADARRALADSERLMRMSAAERRQLGEATRLMDEARRLRGQVKYHEATDLCRKALAIRKKVRGPEHPDTAMSLNYLGSLLQAQGDYAGARPYLEETLTIRKKVLGPEHRDTAVSLNNLGYLLHEQGDYVGARPYYEQTLAVLKKVLGTEHPDAAMSRNNLGTLLQGQGDYAGARPYLEEALAIRKKFLGPEHPHTAMSLNNLGNLLEAQGDYVGARPYYEQTLAVSKKVLGPEHPQTGMSLNNLASLLHKQGDYAGARPYLEEALAISKKALGTEHPNTANSLNNLGHFLHEQGDYAGARSYLEEALAISKKALGTEHPLTASSLNNLGGLLEGQRDYAGARPHLELALAMTQKKLDLAADGLSERQQLAMADAFRYQINRYLRIAMSAGVPAQEAYTSLLQTKGAALARQQRLRLARQQPELKETWEQFQSVSSRLAKLSIATPDPKGREIWRRQLDDATREKEELEVKLMRDSAAFRRQKELRRPTPEQIQKALPADTALVDFLEYMHSTPPPEGKGKMKFERHLVAFIVRPDQPIVRLDLGAAAPITTAIEEWRKSFGRADAALGAGLLTPPSDRPQVSAGPRETFGQSAGHGQETVPQRTPASELRQLVWEPLEAHVKDAKVVLISPDGVLSRFPFAALPGKEPGTYLIEERAVAVVPVPQLLPELVCDNPRNLRFDSKPNADSADSRRDEQQAPSLLLVGDVDYGGEPGKPDALANARQGAGRDRAGLFGEWPHLSGTRTEIATIRDSFEQRFPNGKATVLRQDKATEGALRDAGARHPYLHLATHGFFAPAKIKSALAPAPDEKFQPGDLFQHQGVTGWHPGLLSGLVLAGANRTPEPDKDDGILTALEVASLDLSGVELAVLSACETGLGEVAGGEGVLGLQRAFQVAGAKSVIATLWQVRDDAARSLMIDFYDNLWRKKMSKAEALRQAQIAMLRDGVKRGLGTDEKDKRLPPYYWAGFVLSGDWR